nr:MAG: hypothetical protein [Bacteriophage sp.]
MTPSLSAISTRISSRPSDKATEKKSFVLRSPTLGMSLRLSLDVSLSKTKVLPCCARPFILLLKPFSIEILLTGASLIPRSILLSSIALNNTP